MSRASLLTHVTQYVPTSMSSVGSWLTAHGSEKETQSERARERERERERERV
jgi:hypothetical protein